MGWYGTPGATKQDVIDEILTDWRNAGVLREHSFSREHNETILWAVLKGKKDGHPYQIIACYVISKQGGCWGYKPMDETMGPICSGVPKAWLKLYPCILPDGHTGYSEEWRNEIEQKVS